jgi:hypothetical protein
MPIILDAITKDPARVGIGEITSDMIADGAIVNADVNASAAVVKSKIDLSGANQIVAADLADGNITSSKLATNTHTMDYLGQIVGDGSSSSLSLTITSGYPILLIKGNIAATDTGLFQLRFNDDTGAKYTRYSINTDGTTVTTSSSVDGTTFEIGASYANLNLETAMWVHRCNQGGSTYFSHLDLTSRLYDAYDARWNIGYYNMGATTYITKLTMIVTVGAIHSNTRLEVWGVKG